MTQEQARKETKYFGAGVSVRVSRYGANPSWQITIQRDDAIEFDDWDGVARSVLYLLRLASSGSTPLELWRPPSSYSDSRCVTFVSLDDAKYCIAEVSKALDHIRTKSNDTCWQPIPLNLFELFAATEHTETVNAP